MNQEKKESNPNDFGDIRMFLENLIYNLRLERRFFSFFEESMPFIEKELAELKEYREADKKKE